MFARIEIRTLKFLWKLKRYQIAKAILNQSINTGGITITDLNLDNRVRVKENQNGTGTR
jgi:hypothetical protein